METKKEILKTECDADNLTITIKGFSDFDSLMVYYKNVLISPKEYTKKLLQELNAGIVMRIENWYNHFELFKFHDYKDLRKLKKIVNKYFQEADKIQKIGGYKMVNKKSELIERQEVIDDFAEVLNNLSDDLRVDEDEAQSTYKTKDLNKARIKAVNKYTYKILCKKFKKYRGQD